MSNWAEWEMERRIKEVLAKAKNDRDPNHTFGRPLYTAYQIAIGICRQDPSFLEMTGAAIGGEGTGDQFTLAKYIAGQLSRRIQEGEIDEIEGFFLANDFGLELEYEFKGEEIETNPTRDTVLFRLK
ncbi:hypothetical protein [Thermoflavimicrobium daqui]|uniref:Uncharacterized protein n=1 Tax=Thermoflavimicrobium daqui TaxID=2137476 RepID=A0A364K7E6_9BACL|nr:hypothetical protein [Thermoflavimicrobium daqui]RAL26219.1 hypothetical protein DL897_04265 [Thermoflavimicrobium daqui]